MRGVSVMMVLTTAAQRLLADPASVLEMATDRALKQLRVRGAAFDDTALGKRTWAKPIRRHMVMPVCSCTGYQELLWAGCMRVYRHVFSPLNGFWRPIEVTKGRRLLQRQQDPSSLLFYTFDAFATPGNGSALVLGAWGGFPVQALYDGGYTTRIDAVDPSRHVWEQSCASNVSGVWFHEQTDEAFLQAHPLSKFDAIYIGYGINTAKAERIGVEHLSVGARMLAQIDDGACQAVYEKAADGSLQQLGNLSGWATTSLDITTSEAVEPTFVQGSGSSIIEAMEQTIKRAGPRMQKEASKKAKWSAEREEVRKNKPSNARCSHNGISTDDSEAGRSQRPQRTNQIKSLIRDGDSSDTSEFENYPNYSFLDELQAAVAQAKAVVMRDKT